MAARHAKEPREVVVSRIEGDLLKRLDAAAAADNRSRSETIEMAVREYVDRREKPKGRAK